MSTNVLNELLQSWFLQNEKQPAEVFFLNRFSGGIEACNFMMKETLELVFSCEFCQIFKNTFFYRKPPDKYFWKMEIVADNANVNHGDLVLHLHVPRDIYENICSNTF